MGEFLKIAIPALVGLISGAVGSLIAPWVHWGVERQKLKLLARRELIEKAREALKIVPEKRVFRESVIYSQIKPFLKKRTQQIVESDAVFVQIGGRGAGADNYTRHVLDDLLILEKLWELL